MRKYLSCFLGIPLPNIYQPQFEEITHFLKSLYPHFRTVKPETPHVTLYYVGEQSYSNLQKLLKFAQQKTCLLSRQEVYINGLGVFGSKHPRVAFMSTQVGQPVHMYAAHLRELFPIEEGIVFNPHFTLMRIHNAEARRAFLFHQDTIKQYLAKRTFIFPLTEIVLYVKTPRIANLAHKKFAIISI